MAGEEGAALCDNGAVERFCFLLRMMMFKLCYLTLDKLREMVRLGIADVRIIPDLKKIGIVDGERFQAHMGEFGERGKHAVEQGCHIEVITLRMLVMDIWLRIRYVNETNLDAPVEKWTFGTLIKQCENHARLPTHLVDRLITFNDARNKAIHQWLAGNISYEEIHKASDEGRPLQADVMNFVLDHLPVTTSLPLSPAEVDSLYVRVRH